MTIELFAFTIAAGETKRYAMAGRYLEIVEANDRLSLVLYSRDGAAVSNILNALSGIYVEADFTEFEVTNPSAAAQTVRLMLASSKGGSRRAPGVVSVADAIGAGAQVANVGLTLATGFNVSTILAPASNVRGVRVFNATVSAQAGAGGTANARIYAAPAAPVALAVNPGALLIAAFSPAGVYVDQAEFNMSRTVPPGWGLYGVSSISVAAATSAGAVCTYEVL